MASVVLGASDPAPFGTRGPRPRAARRPWRPPAARRHASSSSRLPARPTTGRWRARPGPSVRRPAPKNFLFFTLFALEQTGPGLL